MENNGQPLKLSKYQDYELRTWRRMVLVKESCIGLERGSQVSGFLVNLGSGVDADSMRDNF